MAERPPATVYLDSGHYVDWTAPVLTDTGWSSTATVDKTASFNLTFPTKPDAQDFQKASAKLVREILDDGQSFLASMWSSASKGFINDGLGNMVKFGGDGLSWATQIPDNPLVRMHKGIRSNDLGPNPIYASAPLIKGCQFAGMAAFYILLLWLLWKSSRLLRPKPEKPAVAPRRWGVPTESEELEEAPPSRKTGPRSGGGRGPGAGRP